QADRQRRAEQRGRDADRPDPATGGARRCRAAEEVVERAAGDQQRRDHSGSASLDRRRLMTPERAARIRAAAITPNSHPPALKPPLPDVAVVVEVMVDVVEAAVVAGAS